MPLSCISLIGDDSNVNTFLCLHKHLPCIWQNNSERTTVHTQHHRPHPAKNHDPRAPPKTTKLAYSHILLFITFSLNYRLVHQFNFKSQESVINIGISRTFTLIEWKDEKQTKQLDSRNVCGAIVFTLVLS